MGVICAGFGRDCDQSKFLIKSEILLGELPVTSCLQKKIWFIERFWLIACEEYGNAPKSFFHLFWECSKAKNTWGSSSLFTSLSLIPFRIFFDFLWYILMDAQWDIEDTGLLHGLCGQTETI